MAAMQDGLMSIGQLAREAGVAATALRYYEREGVLAPTVRCRAGYRLYDRQAAEQLGFIRSAQAVGFTLDDIRALMGFDEASDRTSKKEVQELIEKRLGELAERMRDLRRVQAALAKTLYKCQHAAGECPVLKELHEPDAVPGMGKRKHGTKTKPAA